MPSCLMCLCVDMYRAGMGGMDRDFGRSDMGMNRPFGDSFGGLGQQTTIIKIFKSNCMVLCKSLPHFFIVSSE